MRRVILAFAVWKHGLQQRHAAVAILHALSYGIVFNMERAAHIHHGMAVPLAHGKVFNFKRISESCSSGARWRV